MVRTIQILGQLLKNFPGSLTATEKIHIVEDGFNLGLRGLSFMMQAFEEGRDELIEFVSERVARRYGKDANDEELRRRVRSGLFWLVRLNVFGMIKLISHGVGAKGEENTYRKVVTQMDTNAAKLIEVSIGLDTLKIPRRRILELHNEFKEDIFNKHLLASLVARHLYLFDAPNNIKDELCKRLGIEVQQIDRIDAVLGEHSKRV
ncbi:MAG: hypothetical protein QOD99_2562 [Chthoniobacter sp.]|nr:hypothetical protein [Chthoniobacter sp.]